jgi:hypothetical protein
MDKLEQETSGNQSSEMSALFQNYCPTCNNLNPWHNPTPGPATQNSDSGGFLLKRSMKELQVSCECGCRFCRLLEKALVLRPTSFDVKEFFTWLEPNSPISLSFYWYDGQDHDINIYIPQGMWPTAI